jgi:GAF domain-containing protein
MLATPLRNHLGRTIGVLQVLNKRGASGFTNDDEAIASALSTQAAVAIDNSRLVLSLIQKNRQLIDTKEQLERKFRELSLLFELERATARATSIEELVHVALEQAAGAGDGRGAILRLADEDTGDLVDYVFDRESPGGLSRHPAKSGEGLLGRAMRESEPILLLGAAVTPGTSQPLSFPATSALTLALEGEESALGSIAVFSTGDDRLLSDTDVGLLRLTWLYPDENNGGVPGTGVIRTEVRVFWLRDGASRVEADCTGTGDATLDAVGDATDTYHFVHQAGAVAQRRN